MDLRPTDDHENLLLQRTTTSRECQRAVPDADMQCFSRESLYPSA